MHSYYYGMSHNDESLVLSHSQLHHLEPIGIGTSEVESLTSYISRLSQNHNITVTALVRNLISSKYQVPQSKLHGNDWVTINGLQEVSEGFVSALQQLTQINVLRHLTMLPWKNTLSIRLFRTHKLWCPLCLSEKRKQGIPDYEPLLWCLNAVSVCSIHGVRLRNMCPSESCSKTIRYTSRTVRGFCPHCGTWLGMDTKEIELGTDDEHWSSQFVGHLLQYSASPNVIVPDRSQVSELIRILMGPMTLRKAVHELQIPKSSLSYWLAGTAPISLESVLTLCKKTNLTFQQFIGTSSPNAVNVKNADARITTRKPANNYDKRVIGESLAHLLHANPPLSVSRTAHQLQVGRHTLERLFPDEYRQVRERFVRYRQERVTIRISRLSDEVRQAVTELHARGIYPSHRQMRKITGNSAILRTDREKQTRLSEMIRLGISQLTSYKL